MLSLLFRAARRVERILGESLMQCLGRISFSWYLWAWPLLVLVPMVARHSLSWQWRVAVVWASIALAILSYFLFEDGPRRLVPPALPWFGLSALATAVTTAAALVVIAAPPDRPAVTSVVAC